jgi:hypothetical protein
VRLERVRSAVGDAEGFEDPVSARDGEIEDREMWTKGIEQLEFCGIGNMRGSISGWLVEQGENGSGHPHILAQPSGYPCTGADLGTSSPVSPARSQ